MRRQKITYLRTKNSLTQSDLAEKLFVSQQLVSAWENGSRRPDFVSLNTMASIFGVDVKELYSVDESIYEELRDCIPDDADIDPSSFIRHLNGFLPLLTDKERFIFIRRYYYSDRFGEISQKLNTKENNVRSILSRIRKKLKRYLLKEALYEQS